MEILFKALFEQQLSSVIFVQDYLQLDFDGNRLTCYSWPIVKIKDNSYFIEREGYRDALCEVISHRVSDVTLIENKSLQINFDNGYEIYLKLVRDSTNADLPEFIYFTDSDGGWFVLD